MIQSDDLRVVPAATRDLIPLRSIWLEFVRYHSRLDRRFRLEPDDWPHIRENFARSLRDEETMLFVARNREDLVGYIYGFIFHNNPGYYPSQVGFIRDVFVLQSFKRQGIGKRLVTTLEDWFSERKIHVVQLYAAYENKAGLAAWRKLGYDNYIIGMWKELS